MADLPPIDTERPEGDDSSAGPPPPWVDNEGTPDLGALTSLREQREDQVDLDGER